MSTNTTELPDTEAARLSPRVISHWIDGAEAPSTSGRTAPVYNPATGVVTADVALADEA